MKYWFIADTHFGHRRIIEYCKRPFANITEMDNSLINNWNKLVGKDDIVYHLGDFAFCCTLDYAWNCYKQLNGIKHLILGNHDDLALEMESIRPGTWASVDKLNEQIIYNQRIVMCHYPMATWRHAYKGTWQLYGHVHGSMKNNGKSIDVGVDCWDYAPVSFNQIKEKMANLKINEIIHNKWDKSPTELTTGTDNVENN